MLAKLDWVQLKSIWNGTLQLSKHNLQRRVRNNNIGWEKKLSFVWKVVHFKIYQEGKSIFHLRLYQTCLQYSEWRRLNALEELFSTVSIRSLKLLMLLRCGSVIKPKGWSIYIEAVKRHCKTNISLFSFFLLRMFHHFTYITCLSSIVLLRFCFSRTFINVFAY